MPHPVLDAARAFRAQAMQREQAATAVLTRAYGRVYQRLDTDLRALEESIAGLENPTPDQIRRLGALQALQRQVADEVGRYATSADARLVSEVQASMAAGGRDARDMVLAHFDREWADANGIALNTEQVSRLRAGWTRVPTEAVETMTGMTAPGSPLRRVLVERLGPAVAQQVADTLVAGIALGKNPRAIFREGMAQGLTWSLSTVRTAQLYAYREATRANYQANRDVVSGWKWRATFDGRTCASCLAMHGTLHGVDEVLNDHHQGRCLLPGQMVLTRRGQVPIELVRVGDEVFTHRGRWRAVQKTMQRPYQGRVYRFTQDGAVLTVTPEHPMLTHRGWVPASACNAFDTFWTLNDVAARVSSLSTVQPAAVSSASRLASRAARSFVMCQRGSNSTASIASGNAASMLYEPTASCGTGDNPSACSASINASSPGVQNVCQLACRCAACETAPLRRASGVIIRMMACGLRSIWRRAAVGASMGAIPASTIQRISVRVLTPVSMQSSRYVALSSTYLRRNQWEIGSPIRSATDLSNRRVVSAPTVPGASLSPNAFALCSTDLCVRPGNRAANSIGNTLPHDSTISRSSAAVHLVPDIVPPLATGIIIHHPTAIAQVDYDGPVYNLQVDEDESYIANGIVVHNCTAIPVVPLAQRMGIPEPDLGDAETWLQGRTEAEQRAQLGPGVWGEWRAGRVRLGDLTTTYVDPVYGTMRRAPTLELVRMMAGRP
jgi:hypothetical protein